MKQTLLGPKTQQKHDSKPKREKNKSHQNRNSLSLSNIQNGKNKNLSQKFITSQNQNEIEVMRQNL